MGMRFQILGSSSGGNCALLQTEETAVLIDAGFSARRIEAMLEPTGLALSDIEAVFLTHEHSDHIAGLPGLSRHRHLRFFANAQTASAARTKLKRDVTWRIFETGQTFRFAGLSVETLALPHDAYDPVAFVIRSGGEDLFNPPRCLAWVTDLGYVPSALPARIADADTLVLEANHDLELLDMDMKRPFSVKQRIRGRHGHLSNEAAHTFLQSARLPRLERLFLAHLSRDCNCTDRVAARFPRETFPFAVEIIDPGETVPLSPTWTLAS
ncbi:MAG: MBL fold metallo-hydrolase [Opitutales bacterium]|nr:MBL fold metallo-hydrolase [Opitutales bacterium]